MLMIEDVELTPNPQALKFILNERLLKLETRQFPGKESAKDDPLAAGIFNIDGVVSVFYMDKFVTIEKSPETSWGRIQKPLRGPQSRFFKKAFRRSRSGTESER